MRQVTYALLTRSQLILNFSKLKSSAFYLHVLGTPPAFVLSQDQTLMLMWVSLQKPSWKAEKLLIYFSGLCLRYDVSPWFCFDRSLSSLHIWFVHSLFSFSKVNRASRNTLYYLFIISRLLSVPSSLFWNFSEALSACRCMISNFYIISRSKSSVNNFPQIISKPILADNFYILSSQPNAVQRFLIFFKGFRHHPYKHWRSLEIWHVWISGPNSLDSRLSHSDSLMDLSPLTMPIYINSQVVLFFWRYSPKSSG